MYVFFTDDASCHEQIFTSCAAATKDEQQKQLTH
jgi:hypothetical protein